MRRLIAITTVLMLLGTTVYGADPESRLPSGASEQIRASVRDAIRAGGDPDEVVSLTTKMEESRFSESLMIRAHEIVIKARQEGLPVQPIVNKAFEGIAKRVEAERTVKAMDLVRSRYSVAFAAARTVTTDEKQRQALGTAIAEGMTAGVREKDVTRITDSIRQQERRLSRDQRAELAVQSFQTVREMARFGVSSETVADVVCQALQHQFTAREMTQMRNTFVTEARSGKTESIAQQYGARISGGARAGGLGTGAGGDSGSGGRGPGSSAGSGSDSGSGSPGGSGGSGGAGGGDGAGSGSDGGSSGSGNSGGGGESGSSGGGNGSGPGGSGGSGRR